jgi:hypothetical protein
MKKIVLILNSAFGVFFLLCAVFSLINKNHLQAALLLIISFLLLSPIRQFVYSKTNFKLPFYMRAISIFLLFMILIFSIGGSGQNKFYVRNTEDSKQPTTEQEQTMCKAIILKKIMKVHSKWYLSKEKEIDSNKFIVMASNLEYPPLKPIWLLENRKIYSINGAAKTLTPEFPFTYIIDPVNAVEILEQNKPYRPISHETETVRNTKPMPPIPGREVIGRWWEGMPFNCIEEIYKEKNKYYFVYKLDNGGLVTQELTKNGKKTFKVIDSIGRAGDYFVITENNDLESWDKYGLISTAKPAK